MSSSESDSDITSIPVIDESVVKSTEDQSTLASFDDIHVAQETEEGDVLDAENRMQLHHRMFGESLTDRVDYCIKKLGASDNPINSREIFDITCHLLQDKNFGLRFVDRGGIQKLLAVTKLISSPDAASFLGTIGTSKIIVERVLSLNFDVIDQVIQLALHHLECPQVKTANGVVNFFTSAFSFKVAIEIFDNHDGLPKLLDLLSNHEYIHICSALYVYLSHHLLIRVDTLCNRRIRRPLSVTNEALNIAAELRRNKELGITFMKSTGWEAVDTFLRCDGHTKVLRLFREAQVDDSMDDSVLYAFHILHIVSLVPYSHEQILSSWVNECTAMAVILDAAIDFHPSRSLLAIPQALHVLANLVGPAPSLWASTGCEIFLGPHDKDAIHAAQLEVQYAKAIKAFRASSGLGKLLQCIQKGRCGVPKYIDHVRFLTCQVLIGLARDHSNIEILRKLMVPEKLAELIRNLECSSTDDEDMVRWRREFKEVAEKLIEMLANSTSQNAHFAYSSRELLELIHEYLHTIGFVTCADLLRMEARLNPLATQSQRETLHNIMVKYLALQHRKCKAAIGTLPPLSLQKTHMCRPSREATLNATSRMQKRELGCSFSELNRKGDRIFLCSRLRPWQDFLGPSSTGIMCLTLLGPSHFIAGCTGGEVKLVNPNSGVLQSNTTRDRKTVMCVRSSNSLILSSSDDDVSLWDGWAIDSGWTYHFEGCNSGNFNNSGSKFAALSTRSNHFEVMIFDVKMCTQERQCVDNSKVGTRREQGHYTVHFSPCDSFIMCEGFLWDTRSRETVHHFGELTNRGRGGFHPSRPYEVIIDSNVLDIRSYKVVQQVPAFEGKTLTFDSSVGLAYANQRRSNLMGVTEVVYLHFLYLEFSIVDILDYTEMKRMNVDSPILDLAIDTTLKTLALSTFKEERYDFDEGNIVRLYRIDDMDSDEE